MSIRSLSMATTRYWQRNNVLPKHNQSPGVPWKAISHPVTDKYAQLPRSKSPTCPTTIGQIGTGCTKYNLLLLLSRPGCQVLAYLQPSVQEPRTILDP
jgi:hypothetical protein